MWGDAEGGGNALAEGAGTQRGEAHADAAAWTGVYCERGSGDKIVRDLCLSVDQTMQ